MPVANHPVWPGDVGLTGLGVEGGVKPRVMSAYVTLGNWLDGHTVAAVENGVEYTFSGAILWPIMIKVQSFPAQRHPFIGIFHSLHQSARWRPFIEQTEIFLKSMG